MEWATYRPDFSCASPNFMHLQSTAPIITKLDLPDGLCWEQLWALCTKHFRSVPTQFRVFFFLLNYFLNCLIPQ